MVVAIVALLGACAAPTPTTIASGAPPATPRPSSSVATTSASAAEPSDAPVAESPTELLDCDGPVSPVGGRADDFGGAGGGSTPDEALAAAVGPGFGTPVSGYERLGVVGNRVVYAYEVDGEIKVVVVVSDRFSDLVGAPFTVEELRTCDQAEYGAAVDFGPTTQVWVHEETGLIVRDIEGSSHCDWQTVRFLHISSDEGSIVKQYVRDPEGIFAADQPRTRTEYAEDADLPADATFSGYRSDDGSEIWFTETDDAAFVVTPDGVERWPRAHPPHGCT